MGGQTTLAFWQLLLLSVGPAFLTACVALGAPLLLEGRKQDAEKRKKRGEKLEELIAALYELSHWLDKNKSINVFGKDLDLELTPLSKIEAITSIYFPQYKPTVAILSLRAEEYNLWTVQAGQKRLNKEANFTENFKEVYTPYATALTKLKDELTSFGQKEFG